MTKKKKKKEKKIALNNERRNTKKKKKVRNREKQQKMVWKLIQSPPTTGQKINDLRDQEINNISQRSKP